MTQQFRPFYRYDPLGRSSLPPMLEVFCTAASREMIMKLATETQNSNRLGIHFRPQIIIKISKYCNLRCDYCFEFPFLGNKSKISLQNLENIFINVRRSLEELEIKEIEFVWHGGEPLLIPASYYTDIQSIQQRVFGPTLKIDNVVQTNLTVLTPALLNHLRPGGFFSSIGVSFDPYGDQRVDISGRLRHDTVTKNMQTLIDNNINFGVINVLAQNTLPHVKATCQFFDEIETSVVFLPFYKAGRADQPEKHGLSFTELTAAFIVMFDEWLASEHATPIGPVDEYLQYALAHLNGVTHRKTNRLTDERAFVIDVDGAVHNAIETEDLEFFHGNAFIDPFATIVRSSARSASIIASNERLERHCRPCPYYGACPGRFVSTATTIERNILEHHGCPVRPTIDYIIEVLNRTGLAAELSATASGPDLSEQDGLNVR